MYVHYFHTFSWVMSTNSQKCDFMLWDENGKNWQDDHYELNNGGDNNEIKVKMNVKLNKNIKYFSSLSFINILASNQVPRG